MNTGQDALSLFRVIEDSLRKTMGTFDSTGVQVRVWKRGTTGERLSLSAYAPVSTDSTFSPEVYLSREGPGFREFWARLMTQMSAELHAELYGWIYERAPMDRWELIYAQDDRGVLYERSRARRTPAGTWRVWMRTVMRDSTTTSFGSRYDLSMYDTEIDCAGRRSRNLEYAVYLGNNVVDSGSYIGRWSRWLPETIGEAMYENFCQRVRARR